MKSTRIGIGVHVCVCAMAASCYKADIYLLYKTCSNKVCGINYRNNYGSTSNVIIHKQSRDAYIFLLPQTATPWMPEFTIHEIFISLCISFSIFILKLTCMFMFTLTSPLIYYCEYIHQNFFSGTEYLRCQSLKKEWENAKNLELRRVEKKQRNKKKGRRFLPRGS